MEVVDGEEGTVAETCYNEYDAKCNRAIREANLHIQKLEVPISNTHGHVKFES